MSFQVNCDRCRRFVKHVNGKELKNIIDGEVVCKTCVSVEEKSKAKIDTLKRQAEVEFKRVHTQYKTLLIEAIQEQVAKNYDDPGSV